EEILVLVIGEVLMDIFPEYRRIGGAPFNFSYHLHQFGVPVNFISRIGDDETGKEILTLLKRNKFDADHIQTDPVYPTGSVMVHPDGSGGHIFEIIKDVSYDHVKLPESPAHAAGENPELIYFGTLIQRTPEAFRQIQHFLANRAPETKCFYDINLRPGCYSREIVVKSLEQTDILKINHEEISVIRNMLDVDVPEEEFPERLMKEYDISMISLTRAESGSQLITLQSQHSISVPEFGPVVDTVGAGDAYAAVLALGCLNDWPPQRILSAATEFSARICQIQGAIPEDHRFYESFLNH
ncbi:MAG: hypothetical protein K9J85_12105, partial [Desulfobacteraceae bacterium]|nr:hypothetical protein [Desulfobacteraceae bacterium]